MKVFIYQPILNIVHPHPSPLPEGEGEIHKSTAILGSLRYTTAMDGGSAEIAGANFCPYILGHKKRPAKAGLLEYLY